MPQVFVYKLRKSIAVPFGQPVLMRAGEAQSVWGLRNGGKARIHASLETELAPELERLQRAVILLASVYVMRSVVVVVVLLDLFVWRGTVLMTAALNQVGCFTWFP
ncbi:hypothetical protein BaRGS_00021590 [Batillaria attramentaria]|uniref:Uncharacterized protein n=1 Tax=Batillaria attramentaria TaxID=370345 RepID=A0ABD0KIT1_9CAEN